MRVGNAERKAKGADALYESDDERKITTSMKESSQKVEHGLGLVDVAGHAASSIHDIGNIEESKDQASARAFNSQLSSVRNLESEQRVISSRSPKITPKFDFRHPTVKNS